MAELRRIACVDDDEFIREIAAISLQEVGGFEAEFYPDGPTALNQLEAFEPQLILLDMMMPEMSGLDVLRKLLTIPSLADVPVIFMTAKAQSHEIEEYKAEGAFDAITKPFDPMTLPDELRSRFARFCQGNT